MARKNPLTPPDPSTLPDALTQSDPPPDAAADALDEGAPETPAPPPATPEPPTAPKSGRYMVMGGPERLLYRGAVTAFARGTVLDAAHMDIAYLRRNGLFLEPIENVGATTLAISVPFGVDPAAAHAACVAAVSALRK